MDAIIYNRGRLVLPSRDSPDTTLTVACPTLTMSSFAQVLAEARDEVLKVLQNYHALHAAIDPYRERDPFIESGGPLGKNEIER